MDQLLLLVSNWNMENSDGGISMATFGKSLSVWLAELKPMIELGRARNVQEYYVRLGPLPTLPAAQLQTTFKDMGAPFDVELVPVSGEESD